MDIFQWKPAFLKGKESSEQQISSVFHSLEVYSDTANDAVGLLKCIDVNVSTVANQVARETSYQPRDGYNLLH
jgi:hypothetical protein